jgi:mannitol-1-/sugar-/sorbitol-6-phosphatase
MTNDLILACRAVLFDCDGVLVDSTGIAERAWHRWALEYGLDPDAVLEGVHGRRSAETVALFLPPDRREAAYARIEAIEIVDAKQTRPVPGAPELLNAFPPAWAVVTSASRPLLAARLQAAGVPQPAVAITADDVQAGKPDPEGYRHAAALLGHATGECVVFEDSPTGIRAGHASGAAAVIGVGTGALATDAAVVVADLRAVRATADGLVCEGPGLLRRP